MCYCFEMRVVHFKRFMQVHCGKLSNEQELGTEQHTHMTLQSYKPVVNEEKIETATTSCCFLKFPNKAYPCCEFSFLYIKEMNIFYKV